MIAELCYCLCLWTLYRLGSRAYGAVARSEAELLEIVDQLAEQEVCIALSTFLKQIDYRTITI